MTWRRRASGPAHGHLGKALTAQPRRNTLVLDRFTWEDIRSHVQRRLDLVWRDAKTWRDVIRALPPVLKYSDALPEGE